MCWSAGASVGMVALGAAATAWTLRRGDPLAIPGAFAYFTGMEALQALGYAEADTCGGAANQTITLLSYLHIVFQPFFINAFAMAIMRGSVARPMRVAVYLACGASALAMLLQLYPFDWAGHCAPGSTLCGERLCLTSGEWHIAWSIPYNALVPPLTLWPGHAVQFPTYVLTVFLLPVFYGAWRFAVFHALAGPVLASLLTGNPNEVPAIWCLFSIGLLAIGLSPWLRRQVGGRVWRPVEARPAVA